MRVNIGLCGNLRTSSGLDTGVWVSIPRTRHARRGAPGGAGCPSCSRRSPPKRGRRRPDEEPFLTWQGATPRCYTARHRAGRIASPN
jgi:hypothetical protein